MYEWLSRCQAGAVIKIKVGDDVFADEELRKVAIGDGGNLVRWRPAWCTDEQCDMSDQALFREMCARRDVMKHLKV